MRAALAAAAWRKRVFMFVLPCVVARISLSRASGLVLCEDQHDPGCGYCGYDNLVLPSGVWYLAVIQDALHLG